ncbi:Lariat debranching enzyme [Candida viswanathii]|uniref:Lariat debranching enzyme n=1 Tax=Candida viswanathii TaxID=5486 RepID=A0A367XUU0_9ASCO|nr:Lariat debranching enzyme [Candida viswanathii]
MADFTKLKYGGWVAPNIYYLGEFGSLWFKGIQITGWSGIFNYHSFVNQSVQMEKVPFDSSEIRSVYHTKLQAFAKMYMMNHDMDVVMSHDWPVGIERYGDAQKLLKMKPFFKEDIKSGKLGSPLNKFLLGYLRPKLWCSAHLHVKFEATIKRDSGKVNENELELDMDDEEEVKNKEEIALDMDDEEEKEGKVGFEETFHFVQQNGSKKLKSELTPQRGPCDHDTKFLALDKCGKRRNFLQIETIDVTHPAHPSFTQDKLYYSKRAIAINRVVEAYLQDHKQEFLQIDTKEIVHNPQNFPLVNELMKLVDLEFKKLSALKDEEFAVPENFQIVAPVEYNNELKYYPNNQTQEYCEKFNIPAPNYL